MYFLTSALLALSCILAVSSQKRDESTAFTLYDNFYREYVLKLIPNLREPIIKEAKKTKAAIKKDYPEIENFVDELVDECIIIKYFGEMKKEIPLTLEKLAVFFYMKLLAKYYLLFITTSAEEIGKGTESNVSEEDKQLARNLELMKSILEIFVTEEPTKMDLFPMIKQFFLYGENLKELHVDDKGEIFMNDELTDFDEFSDKIEKDEFAGLISEFTPIGHWFQTVLPNCFMPFSKNRRIPDDRKKKVMEKIDEYGLLDPKPFKYSGEISSRVVKIIQVLIEGDNWRFTLPEVRVSGIRVQPEVGTSGAQSEVGTSETQSEVGTSETQSGAVKSESG